jgi:hypothetical protein
MTIKRTWRAPAVVESAGALTVSERATVSSANRSFECVQGGAAISSIKFWNPVFVVCVASSHAPRVRLPTNSAGGQVGLGVGPAPGPLILVAGCAPSNCRIGASATRPPTSRTEVPNPVGLPTPAGFAFQRPTRREPLVVYPINEPESNCGRHRCGRLGDRVSESPGGPRCCMAATTGDLLSCQPPTNRHIALSRSEVPQ